MIVRSSNAEWTGTIREGSGRMTLGSGAFSGPFSFKTRMESAPGTNPEELIGAAHAGCFSMALAAGLTAAGHPPKSVRTTAKVRLDSVEGGFAITRIDLETEGDVPGLDAAGFQEAAEKAKKGCPVSKALAATPIFLTAKLAGSAASGA